MSVTVGFIVPGPGGDGTWTDGALAAQRMLRESGTATEVITGQPDAIPAHWRVAVCHGGQYAPLLATRRSADQVVIISDTGVVPPQTPAVTQVDWGWPAAFYCAGYTVRDLVTAEHQVCFVAGAAVPTQRALVDAFLSGLLDAGGRPLPVHVTYLPSFDDVATAEAAARRMLGAGVPVLFVSSSDGAGLAALALALAAGAPTISFLAGLQAGDIGAVVSDVAGILAGLVRGALRGDELPPRFTATLSSGQVAFALSPDASDQARASAARAAQAARHGRHL